MGEWSIERSTRIPFIPRLHVCELAHFFFSFIFICDSQTGLRIEPPACALDCTFIKMFKETVYETGILASVDLIKERVVCVIK